MSDCKCECNSDKHLLEKISLQRQIFDIKDRITQLDNFKEMFIKEKLEDLMRFKKLEDVVNKLSDQLEKHLMEYGIYRNKYYSVNLNKPYKCPVCEGEGLLCLGQTFMTAHIHNNDCKCYPCDGKGLVWK